MLRVCGPPTATLIGRSKVFRRCFAVFFVLMLYTGMFAAWQSPLQLLFSDLVHPHDVSRPLPH